MTRYYYELYCEGGFLHRSDLEFESYAEAESEAKDDINFEVSLEPTRKKCDYWYEIYDKEE